MLDRTFTLKFVNVLMQLSVTETFTGRRSLLFGLPPSIENELRRDQESRRLDLDLIVNQLNMPGYIDVKPLLIVAQNACSHTSGRTDLLSTLNGTLQELERYYEKEREGPLSPPPIRLPMPIRDEPPPQPPPDPEPRTMSREAQIDHLYGWGRVKKWIITPSRDAISQEIRVDLGNNYQVVITRVSHQYPILMVYFERNRLSQKTVNDILKPHLESGSSLYQLVKAIADNFIIS